ncbi:hypothetical protein HZH68_000794 [Vespula germanica]|uniref:Uncharacterized protein n=1 Tax=Vespula germanica TaxID=30212 RepID=A0A834U668_VESGE|nr:hypothetical protein HZH68_000794 [Vespula germanica]
MREAENAGMEEKIYGGSSKGGKLKLKLSYASNTAAAEAAATVVAAATAAAATAEAATTAGTAFYSQTRLRDEIETSSNARKTVQFVRPDSLAPSSRVRDEAMHSFQANFELGEAE